MIESLFAQDWFWSGRRAGMTVWIQATKQSYASTPCASDDNNNAISVKLKAELSRLHYRRCYLGQSPEELSKANMSMNIFRLCGDMSHVFSILVLLLRLRVARNAQGPSVFGVSAWGEESFPWVQLCLHRMCFALIRGHLQGSYLARLLVFFCLFVCRKHPHTPVCCVQNALLIAHCLRPSWIDIFIIHHGYTHLN